MATASATKRIRAKRLLDQLPATKLGSALAFLAYLESEEVWDATREILVDDRAMRQIRRSRHAWSSGHRKQFVRWERTR